MDNLNNKMASENQLMEDINAHDEIKSLNDCNLKAEPMMDLFQPQLENSADMGEPGKEFGFEKTTEGAVEQPLDAINKMEVFGEDPLLNTSTFPSEPAKRKRRSDSQTEENLETKKSSLSSTCDEKKIVNLRKNIRDVMDENQLDTDTLAAQREESERLARVAEQQKIIREYQRQTAVNRQFVRTQNRVLSLLKSGNTYAKPAEITESKAFAEMSPEECELSESKDTFSTSISADDKVSSESLSSTADNDIKPQLEPCTPSSTTTASPVSEQMPSDVVTIEDSSSEDDCIMLSDDEEDDLEEEPEDDPNNSGLHVKDVYNVPDEHGRVVVNIGHPEGEEEIFIAPQISKTIKPHQIGGVRFLFDNVIESIKRFKHSSGFGCILAHSMGLGKTMQVICFCDIFLRHTPSKSVLCVMPINTLQNWVSEFNMWIPKESSDHERVRPREFDIYVLNDQHKTLSARAKVVLKWAEQGGVLLIGYELFRLLALKLMPTRRRRGKNINSQNSTSEANARLMESMHQALVKPGPDLVICDEGHRIKNAHAGISLALKQIRTRRRIVLTGYPLQNNLLEYWCMVDFVRPNYLGTRTEFCNMFERPIQNGQCIDSTPEDIKLMRYRAHVLHSLLVGFVQRRSHVVLQQTLPQKLEYVILTRMTSFQRQLYQTFMNDVVRSKAVPNPLKAFAVCCKIWNHPDVLYNFLKKRETDLDLEIDDSEVANEQAPAAVPTDNTNNAKSEESKETPRENETTPIVAPKLECDQSQPQPQNSVLPTPASTERSSTNSAKIDSDSNTANNQLNMQNVGANLNANANQSYNNMYYPANYYQQSSDMTYSSECDGNSYWQEPNVPYFFYHSLPSSVGFPVKPDYVGLMDKDVGVKSTSESGNVTSSSEIVDLDTKEIKTIETDIDMSRNPIIKNNAIQEIEKSNNDKEAELEKDASNTKDVPEESKIAVDTKPIGTSVTGTEKEPPQKIKSEDGIPYEWGIELMKKYQPGLITTSPKMEIFFCILNESIILGDRVLLFSQSLLTLNLIESFLHSNTVPGYNAYWTRNISYFRLDGSTTSQEREKLVNEFNSNHNVKLFLISTRAGSLGINLVGANRVIVFDASWNPCHDTQAVYRIYRYGQTKACYVYRIVMDKCLEKKIYDRQIKKQGMSDRVVDECNPDAHLSMKDVTNLCHDYDDDDVDDKNKSTPPSFSQPLDSFGDVIVQKIIEQYKNCLSKEPFHHESLLIDRKEKKLSQAEKRQAHRGYEMEKKASIKQTSIATINKIQYRIVRNDGTVVNRPVASIRPMQTTKTQNANKSGGIRSTRWIPAEVWQRQGMTAQEMTLPLDVVIPTNSNDKSNIVLRAGQRVMVLKSAKGIYMQLDSGKIIAIRTSNKATEESKLEKGEVIDITSEGDGATEDKNDANKSTASSTKTSPSSNSGSKSQSNDNTNGNNKKSSHAASETNNASSINKNKNAYRRNSNAQSDNNEEKDNFPKQTKELKVQKVESISNDTFAEMKRDTLPVNTKQMAAFPFSSKPYGKSASGPFVKSSKLPTVHKMADAPLVTQQEIIKTSSTPKEQTALPKHTLLQNAPANNQSQFRPQEKDINKSVFKSPHSNANNPNNQFSSVAMPSKDDVDIKAEIRVSKPGPFMPLQPEKRMSQSTDIFGVKTPDAGIANARMSDSKSNFYVQPQKSKQLGNITAKPSKCSYPNLQKGEVKNSPEPFPKDFIDRCEINNESKPQTGIVAASSTDYLTAPCQVTKYGQSVNRTEAVPTHSQQTLPPQQQQSHSKLHLHVPHYNMQHTQFSNSVAPLHMSVAQCMNPETNLASNTFFPSREVNSSYPSHYDTIYNSNNLSASCEYPAQYSDYSAYGSYSHPQYHSQLHTNSYGAASSAASLSANPYNLHWSPLVTPTPLSEQYNAMYPATYSQNGAQSNQWCNP